MLGGVDGAVALGSLAAPGVLVDIGELDCVEELELIGAVVVVVVVTGASAGFEQAASAKAPSAAAQRSDFVMRSPFLQRGRKAPASEKTARRRPGSRKPDETFFRFAKSG